MAKRQKGHGFISRLDVQVVGGQTQLKDQVAVEGHGPLGRPGGTRCVDQKSQVLGLCAVDRGIKKGLTGFSQGKAARQEFIKKLHSRIGKPAQAFTVHDHNAQQLWAVGANFQDLVELLLIFNKQQAAARVLQDVLQLTRRRGGVDAVADQAHALGAHVDVEPFGSVFGQNADHLTAFKPQRLHGQAGCPHAGKVLGPCGALPQAALLVAQGRLIGPGATALAKDFGRRIFAQIRDGGGSVHGVCGVHGVRFQRQVLRRFQRCEVPLMPWVL